eukprot:CAMPEP_0172479308 /NCGR_PEP_ID=MMETSP1066-20121228/3857_1 /TAXON_ID=671091 /ORGANISM="Coscinodiscus wailesii, Strain CCMP2513" /LENGTH=437 /DNA_ID=CAMNT_0013239691 /DNA_START=57 /DNA_END=1370 /DNA_ORIENTATION=-
MAPPHQRGSLHVTPTLSSILPQNIPSSPMDNKHFTLLSVICATYFGHDFGIPLRIDITNNGIVTFQYSLSPTPNDPPTTKYPFENNCDIFPPTLDIKEHKPNYDTHQHSITPNISTLPPTVDTNTDDIADVTTDYVTIGDTVDVTNTDDCVHNVTTDDFPTSVGSADDLHINADMNINAGYENEATDEYSPDNRFSNNNTAHNTANGSAATLDDDVLTQNNALDVRNADDKIANDDDNMTAVTADVDNDTTNNNKIHAANHHDNSTSSNVIQKCNTSVNNDYSNSHTDISLADFEYLLNERDLLRHNLSIATVTIDSNSQTISKTTAELSDIKSTQLQIQQDKAKLHGLYTNLLQQQQLLQQHQLSSTRHISNLELDCATLLNHLNELPAIANHQLPQIFVPFLVEFDTYFRKQLSSTLCEAIPKEYFTILSHVFDR